MLAETINGVTVQVNKEVVERALEIYLNEHLFRDPVKVTHVGSPDHVYDSKNDLITVYEITVQTMLQRLEGEANA